MPQEALPEYVVAVREGVKLAMTDLQKDLAVQVCYCTGLYVPQPAVHATHARLHTQLQHRGSGGGCTTQKPSVQCAPHAAAASTTATTQ